MQPADDAAGPGLAEEPRQLAVLFEDFPSLDRDRLRGYVNGLEPEVGDFEISEFDVVRIPDRGQMAIAAIRCSGSLVALVVHDWPLPQDVARHVIRGSSWPSQVTARLSGHTAYALCTVVGNAEPIEKLIALYKVGLGLIDQGAIGVASEQTLSSFPADLFRAFAEPGALTRLRAEGFPAELVVGFVKLQVEGQLWFLTRGHAMFGLPELAYQAAGLSEASTVADMFTAIFYYLFENGPVVEAGHTMEIEGSSFLRFAEPSGEQGFLGPQPTLIVKVEQTDPGS